MATGPDVWLLAVLLAWAVLVEWPVRPRGEPAAAMTALGYLRRGPYAAIRTAVVELHAGGLVEVAGPGGIARSRAAMRSGGDPLARAVYAAMPTPTGVRQLRGRSRVRRALAGLTGQLAAAGLVPGRVRWLAARVALLAVLGVSAVRLLAGDPPPGAVPWYAAGLLVALGLWFVPRRTVAGHRLLARRRRALTTSRGAPPADPADPVAGFALHGRVPPALARAFARPRPGRRSDHPSTYDHRGVWSQGGWEPP